MFSITSQTFSAGLWNGLWGVFLIFWKYILFALLLCALPTIVETYRKKRQNIERFNDVTKWHNNKDFINKLQGLKPDEFEYYIEELYARLGYETEKVGKSHDGGVDVIATKDGVNHYVQCKKFITRQVKVDDVRAFAGALAGKLANGNGIFITTNVFTSEARKFAEENRIEAIDGDDLVSLLNSVSVEIDSPVTNGSVEKTCPRCHIGRLIVKHGKYGAFLGCTRFPSCKKTEKIE